jgi:predicted nucleic acid-binding protein
MLASRVLTILRPDARDEAAAVALFRKLADQELSFTDCISFALMGRHRITRAFTFDRHFEAAGFSIWP